MITPSYLCPGDKIGIVSTARKTSNNELDNAVEKLVSWGFEVELGKHILHRHHQFAGTDTERAADLQHMLDRKDIKAILCARGGYGTVRIIDQLNFRQFLQHPKWIVGYSDVTVLHSHIHTRCGVETIHGTMPVNFPAAGEDDLATETLLKTFTGLQIDFTLASTPHNRTGAAEGVLCGGNLSILYSLNGTPSDISTNGKILFIEDLDEYLYHIDRMMMNLRRAGKLSGLAALIVGGMSEMNDNKTPFGKTAYEIIAEAVAGYDYPVCFGFPAGHIQNNAALILGRLCRVAIDNQQAHLTYQTP